MGDRSDRHGLCRGRVRQPQRPARHLDLRRGLVRRHGLVGLFDLDRWHGPLRRYGLIWLVCGVCFPPPAARGATLLSWSLDLSLGHDDQILADPAQLGVVSPVSDRFFGGSTRFLVRWADLGQRNRLDMVVDAAGIAYGEHVKGGDTEISLTGAYRRRLSTSLALDLTPSATWFRRDEQAAGDRVFDQDIYGMDARLGLAAARHWVITGGGRFNRATFPGRPLDEQPEEEEHQSQGSVSLAGVRELGELGFISGEVFFRRVTSNVPTAEYGGPIAVLRSRFSLPLRMVASPLVVYGRRSFDHAANEDSTGHRKDESWQLGLTLARSLSPRIGVFLEGTYLDQHSNVKDFEFDQARVSMGFVVQLMQIQPDLGPLGRARKNRLTPVIATDGVRFLYRAPEAGSVSVVGGWNGWDPTQNPLVGPDAKGIWVARVPVPPGIWRYAFVVDGVWTPPPEPPRSEDDGFGGRQGILEVPGP